MRVLRALSSDKTSGLKRKTFFSPAPMLKRKNFSGVCSPRVPHFPDNIHFFYKKNKRRDLKLISDFFVSSFFVYFRGEKMTTLGYPIPAQPAGADPPNDQTATIHPSINYGDNN